jgi:hypothetical protein
VVAVAQAADGAQEVVRGGALQVRRDQDGRHPSNETSIGFSNIGPVRENKHYGY